MAPHAQLSVPSTESLPHAFRLPSTSREVVRTINKLSRKSLLDLVFFWLRKKNRQFAPPYLSGDHDPESAEEDAPYEPAHDHEELIEIYKDFAARKGGKRDVVDRVLEGDWRSGISLFQLATAEVQHLVDHSNSLRWNAQRLAKIENNQARYKDMEVTIASEHLPRFHGQTFLFGLRREVAPLLKAHYFLSRVANWPLTILRVYVHDSPYTTQVSMKKNPPGTGSDASKAVFFVFPDGAPYVYVSLSTHFGQTVGEEARQLRDILLQAVPKALSRPSARYELQSTNLSARDLNTLLHYRGPGITNAAGGGWSIFAENSFSQSALDYAATARPVEPEKTTAKKEAQGKAPKSDAARGHKRKVSTADASIAKRNKDVAEGRFGTSGQKGDNQSLERFEVRIDDPFPAPTKRIGQKDDDDDRRSGRARQPNAGVDANNEDDRWVPGVRVTFQGSHVFAGIRELVEEGVVDGEKMPGWMTGQAGVSIGSVKNGRIRTKGTVPGV